MAPVALNINALWRPWRQAGLTHLLMEPDVALALREATTRSQAVRPQATQSQTVRPQAPRQSTADTPGSPQAPQALRPSAPQQTPPVASTARQVAVPPTASAGPSATVPTSSVEPPHRPVEGPTALPRTEWPAAWLERLQKTPASPRIVWTYDRLAQDLAGLGDGKMRGTFFRGLFAELGMEAGTHALWPLAVPPESGVDAAFFVSGLAVLNPDTVIFMGEDHDEAFEALGLPRIGPLGTALWRGRRFVRLHGVERLQEDTQPRRHRLLSLIKALHRPRG